jgi:UDP-N-acetylglucosamine 2-epimerase (non-hydrolysing)
MTAEAMFMNTTNSRKIIHLIAAARPNFMKIAPLYHALKQEGWAAPLIIHTGQHYDINMSDAFFRDLGLPVPNFHLEVGSGSHAEQTGKVMIAYEKLCLDRCPDLTVVVGDVNSTVAATLAAVKFGAKVAHLEAGLRSFDRTMPEEINRLVTDVLADLLWTPSIDGDENLLREGIEPNKIVRVGNIMIDSLEMMREKIEKEKTFQNYGVQSKRYGLITLHRPSNVDSPEILKRLAELLLRISEKLPLIFPVHPRTKKNLEISGLYAKLENGKSISLAEPLSYIPFMSLVFNCKLVITDSGGIQEETTYLGIPCLTLRPNTERPITVTQGTNQLCNLENAEDYFNRVMQNKGQERRIPEFWDGHTASRVVESIRKFLSA